MSRKILLNVLVVSILITFGVISEQSISIIRSSYGSNYEQMSKADWAKIEDMSYKDAMEYMKTHSRKMDGLEIFKNYFSSFYMFSHFILNFMEPFIVIFVTSLVTALRIIRINGSTRNIDHATDS